MPRTIEGDSIPQIREAGPDDAAREAAAPDDAQATALTQESTDTSPLHGLDPRAETADDALRVAPQDRPTRADAPEARRPRTEDARQVAQHAGTRAVAAAPLEIHAVGASSRLPAQAGPVVESAAHEGSRPVEVEQPKAADSDAEPAEDRSAVNTADAPGAAKQVNDAREIAHVGDGHPGYVGLPTMSTARLVTHRAWAEGMERRANDQGASASERTRAQLELRSSGADKFLDNAREPRLHALQARRASLERLEHRGFSDRDINDLRGIIASSGLPIRGLTSFVHEADRTSVDANGNKGGQVIASMHTHGEHAGRFTVHDAFYAAPEEEKKATAVHELTHNLSSLRPENSDIYGEGEAGDHERQAIASYVSKVAEQSLLTGVHLNGYHKHLMQEFSTREATLQEAVRAGHLTEREAQSQIDIARYKYVEETQAILTEMAFFKRSELERVQSAQAQKFEDIARALQFGDPNSQHLPAQLRGKRIEDLPERVDLITNAAERGHGAPGVGADRIAITLLRGVGVTNHDELLRHIGNFKGPQWGNRSPRVQQRARELQAA